MIILRLLIGLIIIFLLVAFALRNMTPVHLDFYFYKTPDVPLFVMLYLTLLVGVAVAWIMVISEQLRLRMEIRKRDKKIKELEKMVSTAHTPQTKPEEGEENDAATQGIQS